MRIRNQAKYETYRRSRKPLCTDPLLLNQEVGHSLREISSVLRVHESTVWRWKRKYGLPVPYLGRGILTTKTLIADWLWWMARGQWKLKQERTN